MRCHRYKGYVIPGCWAVALSGREDFVGCICRTSMCPERREEAAAAAAAELEDKSDSQVLGEILKRLRDLEKKVDALS